MPRSAATTPRLWQRRCPSTCHEITLAKTGPEGLAAGLQEAFDLILLDIELPGLKGDAICRQLHEAGVRTPMVALTASAMPDQIAIFHAAGFDEVITKPVEPQYLREMAMRYARGSEEVSVAPPVGA